MKYIALAIVIPLLIFYLVCIYQIWVEHKQEEMEIDRILRGEEK